MEKRVLIVEDSTAMRSMIASTVEEMKGYVTVEAANGFEALRIIPKERFDLIITDINMPHINGLEIISFVKNHPSFNSIPIIIVTTEHSEEDRKKGISLGASEYVIKPFNPDHLKKVVKKVLGG
ncbi:MAG TPA: response regulator [Nitrospiria bacterium]|nr:response regulator [Nitrospiria bacterium]